MSDNYENSWEKEIKALVPRNQLLRRDIALKVIENVDLTKPIYNLRWISYEQAKRLVKDFELALYYFNNPSEYYDRLGERYEKVNKKVDRSLDALLVDIKENVSLTNEDTYYAEFGIQFKLDDIDKSKIYYIPDEIEERIIFIEKLLQVFNKYYLNNLINGETYWRNILNEFHAIFDIKTEEQIRIIYSIKKRAFLYNEVGTLLKSILYLTAGNFPSEWRELALGFGFEEPKPGKM
jgi:hypothetical protein